MGKEFERESDREIFRKLVEWPEVTMRIIVKRYSRRLQQYCRRFFNYDDDLIQDVVSETFLALWLNREKVAQLENPFGWMLKVAENVSLYILRGESKYTSIPIEQWEAIIEIDQADTSINFQDLTKLTEEVVRKELSPKERLIFSESRLEGFSNKEIVKRHDIADQTVKNTSHRALKKVRKALLKLLGK